MLRPFCFWGAANDLKEPNMPVFCIAANVRIYGHCFGSKVPELIPINPTAG